MKTSLCTGLLLAVLALFGVGIGCSGTAGHAADPEPCIASLSPESYRTPRAFNDAGSIALDTAIDRLLEHRVVLIGEQHDRFDHHLNQLEVLCRLRARGAALAIGFEAFQQPFQGSLDAYVAGRIDLAELIERSEYYERWRFDHRLYAPLLEFGRRHRIPLVALNVPREMVTRISDDDLKLGPEDHSAFPYGLGPPDGAYRARIKLFFDRHPRSKNADLGRFTRVQWLWDEAMGQRAARYLAENPDRTLVVIAGSGHVAYADAIPGKLLAAASAQGGARLPSVGRVLQAVERPGVGESGPLVASHSTNVPRHRDVWFESEALHLPVTGRLGVFLEPSDGQVRIKSLGENSAAGEVGMLAGDRIVRIGSHGVDSYLQVRLALADARPGDTVNVRILRPGEAGPREFVVTLR